MRINGLLGLASCFYFYWLVVCSLQFDKNKITYKTVVQNVLDNFKEINLNTVIVVMAKQKTSFTT